MSEANRPLVWVLVLVGLTFPLLVARAVWEADWVYLIVVALLAAAGVIYMAWEWRGSVKAVVATLAIVITAAFISQKIFG